MKKLFPFSLAGAAALIVILGLITGGDFFQARRTGAVSQTASLSDVVGVVEMQPAGSDVWQPVAGERAVQVGDLIRTGDLSSVTLVFFDGSRTSLGANTRITVAQLSAQRDGSSQVIVLDQWLGQTLNRVERLLDPASRFEIETPTAVTAVRGTEFMVQVDDDGATQVTVAEGIVNVTAQETTIEVQAGQSTSVQPDDPPAPVEPATTPPQPPAGSDDLDILTPTMTRGDDTETPAPTMTITPGDDIETPTPTMTPDDDDSDDQVDDGDDWGGDDGGDDDDDGDDGGDDDDGDDDGDGDDGSETPTPTPTPDDDDGDDGNDGDDDGETPAPTPTPDDDDDDDDDGDGDSETPTPGDDDGGDDD